MSLIDELRTTSIAVQAKAEAELIIKTNEQERKKAELKKLIEESVAANFENGAIANSLREAANSCKVGPPILLLAA